MSLVAQWPLDSVTSPAPGQTPDASGNGWVGALSPSYPTDSPILDIGPYPGVSIGMKFNGSSQYVNVSLVHQVGDVFSIAAWVFPSSLARKTIYSAGNVVNTPIFSVSYLGDGGLEIAGNGAFFDVSAAGAVSAGKWTHVVYSRAGATPQSGRNFFANGKPLSCDHRTDTVLVNSGASALLGCRAPGTQSWQGNLCDVRLYNHALSASEVYTLYEDSLRTNAALLGLLP